MMTLTAAGYSSTYAQFPVALTFSGITANAPRALNFSVLRFIAVLLALLAVYGLRPASGLWHRRWLAGNVCDRAAAAVLGLVLAAFVVVVPFWEPGNTGLAAKITTPHSGTVRAPSASSTSSTAHWPTAC